MMCTVPTCTHGCASIFSLPIGFFLQSYAVRCFLLTPYKMDITFTNLSEDKKRNVVTYVLQTVVTTIALALQVHGGKDILFQMEDATTPERLDIMVLALILVGTLYIWELVYREKIGLPLLIHHIVTLLLIQTCVASLLDTGNMIYVRYAILLGFHATTEQPTFVALFCFRLNVLRKYQASMFFFSSAQAFLIKTAITIAMVVLVVQDLYVDKALDNDPTNWTWFWKVFTLPLIAALYGSQCYASRILYSVAKKCASSDDDADTGTKTTSQEEADSNNFHQSFSLDAYENTVGQSLFKRRASSMMFLQDAARCVQEEFDAENSKELVEPAKQQNEATDVETGSVASVFVGDFPAVAPVKKPE